jgi:hypothetical protein
MKTLLNRLIFSAVVLLIISHTGCLSSRSFSDRQLKVSVPEMKEDFLLLKNVLEKHHPSLYAYTDKQTQEEVFSQCLEKIRDSMSADVFAYAVIAPFLSTIRCGHTYVSISKQHLSYLRQHPKPGFPLHLRFLGDTIMVFRNLVPKDSMLKKGTIIKSINGMDADSLKRRLFAHFPMDGYSETVNIARLNNNFPYYFRMVTGVDTSFVIQYINEQGSFSTQRFPAFFPTTPVKNQQIQKKNISVVKSMPPAERSLRLDTASGLGFLYLANFEHPIKTHRFIRKSFKALANNPIQHLIIDLRTNGGGVIDNEVFLARHLRKTPFRVADSAVAKCRTFRGERKYFRNEWINETLMRFLTKKDSVGNYHMDRYWEKRSFKPVRRNFFNGHVYILTGGMTFSAASLFCNTMKGQARTTLIGEETGGGGYVNNGLLIPDFVLPNSKNKVRIPLFRIVPNKNAPNNGRGVIPDIHVIPSTLSLKNGYDPVLLTTLSLIQKNEQGRR